MSDDERAGFDRAYTKGWNASEHAREAVHEGDKAEAEAQLLESARQLDAALRAIRSEYRVRVEPEP